MGLSSPSNGKIPVATRNRECDQQTIATNDGTKGNQGDAANHKRIDKTMQ